MDEIWAKGAETASLMVIKWRQAYFFRLLLRWAFILPSGWGRGPPLVGGARSAGGLGGSASNSKVSLLAEDAGFRELSEPFAQTLMVSTTPAKAIAK